MKTIIVYTKTERYAGDYYNNEYYETSLHKPLQFFSTEEFIDWYIDFIFKMDGSEIVSIVYDGLVVSDGSGLMGIDGNHSYHINYINNKRTYSSCPDYEYLMKTEYSGDVMNRLMGFRMILDECSEKVKIRIEEQKRINEERDRLERQRKREENKKKRLATKNNELALLEKLAKKYNKCIN